MHVDAIRVKQFHNGLLQHDWSGFRKSLFTQKMKNIEVDGRKVRMQIVRFCHLFSGILLARIGLGPLLRPIISTFNIDSEGPMGLCWCTT